MYCARRILAYLRCTHLSILLHPSFNPVAPYRYLLPNFYMSVADIANPDLSTYGSRTWISLDIAHFMRRIVSGSAWPAFPKTLIGAPLLGARGVETICTGFARPPETAPRRVGCVAVLFVVLFHLLRLHYKFPFS